LSVTTTSVVAQRAHGVVRVAGDDAGAELWRVDEAGADGDDRDPHAGELLSLQRAVGLDPTDPGKAADRIAGLGTERRLEPAALRPDVGDDQLPAQREPVALGLPKAVRNRRERDGREAIAIHVRHAAMR
jgi:hypothetical protein